MTVAKYFEVDDKTISSVVSNFKPLRHRIEFAGEKDGVLYFNDSKATNISSTLCALGGFDKNVILMLGGQAKQQNFDNLFKKRFQNVKFFVIYGEDHEIIEKSLKKFNKKQNFVLMKTFDEAFEQARSNATAGDVVLLSPACASFDEFKNFEERGDRFCEKLNKSRCNLKFSRTQIIVLVLVLFLVGFGCLMVYSASSYSAAHRYHNQYYF